MPIVLAAIAVCFVVTLIFALHRRELHWRDRAECNEYALDRKRSQLELSQSDARMWMRRYTDLAASVEAKATPKPTPEPTPKPTVQYLGVRIVPYDDTVFEWRNTCDRRYSFRIDGTVAKITCAVGQNPSWDMYGVVVARSLHDIKRIEVIQTVDGVEVSIPTHTTPLNEKKKKA